LPTPGYGCDRSAQDLLPAFSALASDEDREKKAQLREPGTYLVVANLNSFASLPEYGGDDMSNSRIELVDLTKSAMLHSASNKLSTQTTEDESDDPNIIILKTFEEPLRRSPVSPRARSAPPFAHLSQPGTAPETPAESIHASVHGSDASVSRLDQARSGGRDAHLLAHYRSKISQRVIKVGSQEVEEDEFEIQARTFPPVGFFFLFPCLSPYGC
jgi:hypothetical protein